MKKVIPILEGELWYGGAVGFGDLYPLGKDSTFEEDLRVNPTSNQLNPVFFSNRGRYIWMEESGKITFRDGNIEVEAESVQVETAGTTLKEASLAATGKHYPPTGTMPDKRAFLGPQYCSWVVLLWNQNQEGLLKYARGIIEKGFQPGLFIIDDTWQKNYGVWEFDRGNFPDPEGMMRELRDMGFLISMWLCPYVSLDAPYLSPGIYEHMEADRVLKDGDRPHIVSWWEGYSAQLDFTKESAVQWLNQQTKRLEREYGVSGFKLDGGDPIYHGMDYVGGNLQSMLYINSIDNAFKEARSCYKLGGQPIIQRLNDKAHLWKSASRGSMGLDSLVPLMMAQSLAGYYYGCADMVGGGISTDFIDKSNLDDELIIRWCQASALFPMIQFSLDVWNREENRVAECCKKAMDLRNAFVPYILELLENASHTGIPAIRYLEYQYPNEHLGDVKDQFMLGDKYMVAPVLEKGATARRVRFPNGLWRDISDGKIFCGGEATVDAPLDKLPVFERVEEKTV